MQQFFGLVNTLLAGTPPAAARRLGMGTYRVVPISPAAGAFASFRHGPGAAGAWTCACHRAWGSARVPHLEPPSLTPEPHTLPT